MSTLPVTLPPLDQQTRQQLLAQEAQRGGLLPLALPAPQQAAVPVQQQAAVPVQQQAAPAQLVDPFAEMQKLQALREQAEQRSAQAQQLIAQRQQAYDQARQQYEQTIQQAAEKPPEMPTTFRKPKWWETALGMGIGALAGAYGTDTPLGQAGLIAGSAMAHRNQVEALRQWQAQLNNWSLRHKQALEMAQLVARREDAARHDLEFAWNLAHTVTGEIADLTFKMQQAGLSFVPPEAASSLSEAIAQAYKTVGLNNPPKITPYMPVPYMNAVMQGARMAVETAWQKQQALIKMQELRQQRDIIQMQRMMTWSSAFDRELDSKQKSIVSLKDDTVAAMSKAAFATSPDDVSSPEVLQALLAGMRLTGGGRLLKPEIDLTLNSFGYGASLEAFLNRVGNDSAAARNVVGNPKVFRVVKSTALSIVDEHIAVRNAFTLAHRFADEALFVRQNPALARQIVGAASGIGSLGTQRVLVGVDSSGFVVTARYYDLGLPELTEASRQDAIQRLQSYGAIVGRGRVFDVGPSELPSTMNRIYQAIDSAQRMRSSLPTQTPSAPVMVAPNGAVILR
jgi:hypothetical protein